MPVRQSTNDLARYPIVADWDGCTVKRGELEVRTFSGRLRGNFIAGAAGRWLEGTADLASAAVDWQEKTVAAPVLHAAFSRSGGKGNLSGQLCGGKLAGSVAYDPFAPSAGESFDLGVTGADLATAARLFLPPGGVTASGGLANLRLNGAYSGRDALDCRFQASGSGIALTGAGGKSLVSGAGLSLAGTFARGDLKVDEASLVPAKGVELNFKAEMARAFSANRRGSLTFSLAQTPLNALVAPFINLLPRIVQESTVGGTLAAKGKIDLTAGRKLVEGALSFQDAGVEVPSQKLNLAQIGGRIPFSLDLSGKAAVKAQDSLDFSRENYPRLLERLRSKADGGELFSIGKITFGTLEFGKLTMRVSAGNGGTEISSLRSSFYEGALLGRGFFTPGRNMEYRGDLLVQGLSMKALCSKIPNIKGYISGRVAGIISVSGRGGGVAGLTGFTDLWARAGAGEKMLVSREFLQRLSKQKLSGFFFSSDRNYDEAEIKAMLMDGDMTFDTLKIAHTNLVGVRDLSVSIAPAQNRIALDHFFASIKEASLRGKPTAGGQPAGAPAADAPPAGAPVQEFKWGE